MRIKELIDRFRLTETTGSDRWHKYRGTCWEHGEGFEGPDAYEAVLLGEAAEAQWGSLWRRIHATSYPCWVSQQQHALLTYRQGELCLTVCTGGGAFLGLLRELGEPVDSLRQATQEVIEAVDRLQRLAQRDQTRPIFWLDGADGTIIVVGRSDHRQYVRGSLWPLGGDRPLNAPDEPTAP